MWIRLIMAAMIAAAVAVPGVPVALDQQADLQQTLGPGVPRRLPDLVVESINFSPSASGDTVTVKITGSIYNGSTENSWCCPTEAGRQAWKSNPVQNMLFKWKKYVRSVPRGTWTELVGDVLTMLNPQEHQTFIFFDHIPKGAEREYKIVLDPDNWINESNKDNNTKTKVFSSRS